MAPTSSFHDRRRSEPSTDPFALLLLPPPNESPIERDLRIKKEAEAKKVSEAIDEDIKIEKELLRKRRQFEVKLLLLGQSESGKSTTVKQFQLLYAPETLESERASWRTVVYINIVKSLRSILDAMDYDHQQKLIQSHSTSALLSHGASYSINSLSSTTSSNTSDSDSNSPLPPLTSHPSSSSLRTGTTTPKRPHSAKTEALLNLRLRLSPLLIFEKELTRKLSGVSVQSSFDGSSEEILVRRGWQAASSHPTGSGGEKGSSSSSSSSNHLRKVPSRAGLIPVDGQIARPTSEMDQLNAEVANVLGACKEDVKKLWTHPSTASMMRKRRFRMEDWSGFFLDDLDRIASPEYTPTDEDILRARLRTLGIMEYTFDMSMAPAFPKVVSWHLYDVGGARGQRHSWAPYFEDANAIIFLAPISAFDQYLEEDPRVNRVDDSLQLFTAICNNPLLKNVHLVLFLNKMDVLKKKLEGGVKVKRYITSYADRPNDLVDVTKYFKAHFQQVHRKSNEHHQKITPSHNRELYTHLTSIVDTQATRNIIKDVNDAIFKTHLKSASIL